MHICYFAVSSCQFSQWTTFFTKSISVLYTFISTYKHNCFIIRMSLISNNKRVCVSSPLVRSYQTPWVGPGTFQPTFTAISNTKTEYYPLIAFWATRIISIVLFSSMNRLLWNVFGAIMCCCCCINFLALSDLRCICFARIMFNEHRSFWWAVDSIHTQTNSQNL